MKRIYVKGSKLVRVVKNKSIKTHIISAVFIIVVILIAARFVHGGAYYESVSLICYGFMIGYLGAWLHAKPHHKSRYRSLIPLVAI